MTRWLLSTAVLFPGLLTAAEPANTPATDAPATGFVEKTFTNADGSESPYVVFVPHAYDGTKPLPVLLFLHGSGETKGGKKMPVEVGLGPAIKDREKTFPFLAVIPQSEKRTWQAGVGRRGAGAGDPRRGTEGVHDRPGAGLPDRPEHGRVRDVEPGRGPPGQVGGDRPGLRRRRPGQGRRSSRACPSGRSTGTPTGPCRCRSPGT